MMKRNLILPVVSLLSATFPVGAASVFPAAATNYIFTTPYRPAHVRGTVMGSPPAYYIPRSEDLDWLNEAVWERLALSGSEFAAPYNFGTNTVLRPEFGRWDLSETNRFYRWVTATDAAGVTNVVIGYNLVTNTPTSTDSPWQYYVPGSGTAQPSIVPGKGSSGIWPEVAGYFYNPTASHDYHWGYLDPGATLITAARAFKTPPPAYTNIYKVAYYTAQDPDTVTNGFSTIEMPMTNGTVSVHTNKWWAYKNELRYHTVTAVVELAALDYCHLGGGAFPGFTNAPPLPSSSYSFPVALSNSYVALRGATRLADWGNHIYPTNSSAFVEEDYYMGALYFSHTSSNSYYRGRYEIDGRNEKELSDYDENHNPVYEWVYRTSETRSIPRYQEVAAPTRFHSDLVTTGGVRRVTVEAAFAIVDFSYTRDAISDDGTTRVADISKDVVVPVFSPRDLVTKVGKPAYWESFVEPRELLEKAAAASGAPAPPQNAASFVPAQGSREYWQAEWSNFILIYRTHPTSKFADWESQ